MSKTNKTMKIESPVIPSGLSELTADDILSSDHAESGVVQDCIIERLTGYKTTFDKMIFKKVAFRDCALNGVELTDVVFEQCDLSNADFSEAIIHRTAFKECKLVGIHLAESTLRNVLFDQCTADFAAFRFIDAKQAVIRDSSFRHTDISFSKLQKTEFQRTNLDQAQLSGTKLNGIDLSDCQFDGLGVGIEEVQGCIITREQAYLFASLFGLVIKEDS